MIHLGYTVGSGERVTIPLKHMAVTGMTQEAGKTTALEALIARSGLRAVTFITKRGEGSFSEGRRIAPFFRERADWQFVDSLINATMGEKNNILRPWLMKVCADTKTLADVQRNVREARPKARGFPESMYTQIEGYLDLVVPQLAELPPAAKVVIHPGLNVMDLSSYRPELQGLVIRSVIEHVYENETDVITVIPEAWEFLPEGRGSPVKLAAETLIRKGAALRNYIWVDAQDLGGLWKTVVRAAAVYLIGVQRESNEVKRTLANLPASTPKLNAADVASLELGQFFACWGKHAIRTYVQPAWMSEADAHLVAASGGSGLDIVKRPAPVPRQEDDQVNAAEAIQLTEENARLKSELAAAVRTIASLEGRLARLEARSGEGDASVPRPGPDGTAARRERPAVPPAGGPRGETPGATGPADGRPPRPVRPAPPPPTSFADLNGTSGEDLERLYTDFKARLLADAEHDPAVLRVLALRSELVIQEQLQIVTAEGSTTKGRTARLIADGFFDDTKRFSEVLRELKRTGTRVNNRTLAVALSDLVVARFLTKEGQEGYRLAPGAKVRVETVPATRMAS